MPKCQFALFLMGALVCLSLSGILLAQDQVPSSTSTPQAIPDLLFARTFINFAWGAQFNGLVIDTAGQVFSFNADDQISPEAAPKILTQEYLKQRFAPKRKLLFTLPQEEVDRMVALLPAVAAATDSAPVHEACDMGSYAATAFYQDPASGQLREIDLRIKGDVSSYNLAPEAKIIADWLDGMKAPK